MKISKKTITVTVLVVIFLVIIVWRLLPLISFFAFLRPQVHVKQTTGKPVGNLINYQDNEHVFEFDYPEDWVVTNDEVVERNKAIFSEKLSWPRKTIRVTSEYYPEGEGKPFPVCIFSVSVYSNPDGLEPDPWYRKQFDEKSKKEEVAEKHIAGIKETTINNLEAIEASPNNYYVTSEDYAYRLSANSRNYERPLNKKYQCWEAYEKIMDSFEILKEIK